MIDIKFLRENPDIVKENIKKKFQDRKLELVDRVIELDVESRRAQTEANELRADRNRLSKEIGALMKQGKKDEAEATKAKVNAAAERLAELEAKETELAASIREIMLTIPNIIDDSVPVGRDDSENVEIERFGEPVVPDFEIPYHTDIMERSERHRSRQRAPRRRKRILLPHGRHRAASFVDPHLRTGFHDRARLHLLRAAVHDPFGRCDGRHEL